MANSKISALTSASTPLAGTEVLPIVQGGSTVKVAVSDLTAGRGISASSVTNSGLTSGRVTYATTSGLLADSANFQFDGTVLGLGGSPIGTVRQYIKGTGATSGSWALYVDNSTPSNIFSIRNDGIVTMSTYGAGAATFSATGVISSVSDETWKIKDGVPADPDSMLKKLEPGYWYYNDEKKEVFGAERQLGFYAQNVNKAIGPEAAPTPSETKTLDDSGDEVGTGQFRPWGYYDRSVLAVVVMSLKNALATIEQLETRLAALEAK